MAPVSVRKLDGSFEISNLDTWVNTLLTEDEIITLGLPKLPQRHVRILVEVVRAIVFIRHSQRSYS